MASIEKKRKKINERISFLENEMRLSLTQKTSNTKEISVSDYTRKISDLKKELALLK